MSGNYTTNWNFVNDGDTTSVNPKSLIGETKDIVITNAEIQWQGDTTSNTYNTTKYKSNTNYNNFSDVGATQGSLDHTGSYPSVPSGYNFHRHVTSYRADVTSDDGPGYVRTYTSNSTADSGTWYFDEDTNTTSGHRFSWSRGYNSKNLVGTTTEVTLYKSNGHVLENVRLTLRTTGKKTVTKTDYYDTTNPGITGDATASYSGSIGNNNTSSWVTVSGLSSGTNQLTHNIDGSNQGYYRISFDWEYAFPTPIAEGKIPINGTTYSYRLCDPTDPNLDYSVSFVEHPTHGKLAIDLVDPSDPDALSAYIYHSVHGKLAIRQLT